MKLLIFFFSHNDFNFIKQLSYLLWRFCQFFVTVFKVVCRRFVEIVPDQPYSVFLLSFIEVHTNSVSKSSAADLLYVRIPRLHEFRVNFNEKLLINYFVQYEVYQETVLFACMK